VTVNGTGSPIGVTEINLAGAEQADIPRQIMENITNKLNQI
jgi:hypothetical protein